MKLGKTMIMIMMVMIMMLIIMMMTMMIIEQGITNKLKRKRKKRGQDNLIVGRQTRCRVMINSVPTRACQLSHVFPTVPRHNCYYYFISHLAFPLPDKTHLICLQTVRYFPPDSHVNQVPHLALVPSPNIFWQILYLR